MPRQPFVLLLVVVGAMLRPGSGQVALDGDHLDITVTTIGTLGAWQFDPDGPGGPLVSNGDWITPGTPWEGWAVSWDGGGPFVNNTSGGAAVPVTVTNTSMGTLRAARVHGVAGGVLDVEHVLRYETTSKSLEMAMTLTNIGTVNLNNVETVRFTDPDIDHTQCGQYPVAADVVDPTTVAGGMLVTGMGNCSGRVLGLGTHDSGTRQGSVECCPTNPDEYIDSPMDPNGATVDYLHGLGWRIPVLAPGESITFTGHYLAGTSVSEVTTTFIALAEALAVRGILETLGTVCAGDTGLPIAVEVENTSMTNPAQVSSLALSFVGTVDRTSEYSVTPDPLNPTQIPAGTTAIFLFMVDASAGATPEAITIDAAVTGTIAGRPTSDGGADTPGDLDLAAAAPRVLAVTSPRARVWAGQTMVPVSVTVENPCPNDILSVALNFRVTGTADRTSEYVFVPDPGNPTVVPGGGIATQFNWLFDVSAAATIEAVTVDVAFSGSSAPGAFAVSDPDADSPLAWDVVLCAATLCGDCNLDGMLTILDALVAAQGAAALIAFAPQQFTNCNVFGAVEPDPLAAVDVLDALRLAQVAAGLPISMMCC